MIKSDFSVTIYILKGDENNLLNHAFWSLILEGGSGLVIARNRIILKLSEVRFFSSINGIIMLRGNFVETLVWPGEGLSVEKELRE